MAGHCYVIPILYLHQFLHHDGVTEYIQSHGMRQPYHHRHLTISHHLMMKNQLIPLAVLKKNLSYVTVSFVYLFMFWFTFVATSNTPSWTSLWKYLFKWSSTMSH